MPRKTRIHYVNAMYHVMMRGNHKQKIFFKKSDYERFENHLRRIHQTFNCKIHFYCLMTNHVHLVLEVDKISLDKIMLSLQATYAKEVHKEQNLCGHLFQGRYLAKLIQSERYFLELCFYVHNNPIKAGIVNCLEEYLWSSHLNYANKCQQPWVTKQFTLELISKHYPNSRSLYLDFISNRNESMSNLQFIILKPDGRIEFKDDITKMLNTNLRPDISHLKFEDIVNVVITILNIKLEDLISPSLKRDHCIARSFIGYFGHYCANYKMCDIAAYFQREPNSMSKSVSKIIKNIGSDQRLKSLHKLIENRLYIKCREIRNATKV